MKRQGRVQFYIKAKGYGYIRVKDTFEEFHFRKKNLKTAVEDGDKVEFEVGKNEQGLFAKNVTKV